MMWHCPPLRLRRTEPEDGALLYEWENLPELASTNTLVEPLARYQAQELVSLGASSLLSHGSLMLIAEHLAEHLPVGYIQLYNFEAFHRRAAIGLMLLPTYQNRGWGSLMLSTLLRYCFGTLHLHQVYAEVEGGNVVAQHLFRKHSFLSVAQLPEWLWQEDGYRDLLIYRLCQTQYKSK